MRKNPYITFCGVYWNEAPNVRRVLDWAKSFFSDMVLAVQQSSDETKDICLEYTPNVLLHPQQSPEKSKTEIMEKIKTPWTFWMDADELPSRELVNELKFFNPDHFKEYDSFNFPRVDYVDGLKVEVIGNGDRQYRLLRSDVRPNLELSDMTIHTHFLVKNTFMSSSPIYHYRTLEKITKRTQTWNQLEPKYTTMCNDYLDRARKEIENVHSKRQEI